MCAYNHINGPYACGSPATLTTILRKELGFTGFVTSDWGATHSALFMKAGLDVEMIDGPDGSGFQEPAFLGAQPAAVPTAAKSGDDPLGELYGGQLPEERTPAPPDGEDAGMKVAPKTLAEALADGSVTQATVDQAAGRVLRVMDRFGRLSPGRRPAPFRRVEANARIIERTAEEAAVLLKNDAALPLSSADLQSIVFIGPTAGQVDAIGISGERSMGLVARQVGPVEAVRRLSGASHVAYAVDDDMTGSPVPPQALSHGGQPGLQRAMNGSLWCDSQINFTIQGANALPPDTRAVWSGALNVPADGDYWLNLQALGANARLAIDGKLVAMTGAYQGDVHGDILQPNLDNVLPTTDGLDNVRRVATLTAGQHTLELRIEPDSSHAPAQVRLNWSTPRQRQSDHAAAIAAAKTARTAVVFAWARRAPAFMLPGDQNALIEEVAAVNPNTIVVLNSSQPVAAPWAEKVKAVLEMWWPGDEGGWATAKLLLGQANPAGRLPVTWARSLADYPASDPRFPERSASTGATTFSEGLDIGYRWFDRNGIEPLYPFGHGLSYTRFRYSRLRIRGSSDGGLNVRVRIRNTGSRAGDEAPQVYLGPPEPLPAGADFPVRKLVAFERIALRPGQIRTVDLHVPLRQLQYWSTARHGWATPSGRRRVYVGASSRDVRLRGDAPRLQAP